MELDNYEDQFEDKKERIIRAAEGISGYLANARALVRDKQTDRALRKGERHAHRALGIINQAQTVPTPRPKRAFLTKIFRKGVALPHQEPESVGLSEMDLEPESDQSFLG